MSATGTMPHPSLESLLEQNPSRLTALSPTPARSEATERWLKRQAPVRIAKLRSGQVLLDYHILSNRQAQVQVDMYLQQPRDRIWQQVTDYASWPQLLPHILHSERLPQTCEDIIYLRQAAGFDAGLIKPQVEIVLQVREWGDRAVRFQLERGSFSAFTANLSVRDCEWGTFLRYEVEAELCWPVPRVAIEQGIRHALPHNLKAFRDRLQSLPDSD